MPSEMAERFMSALQDAEKTGKVDSLVDLFADGAELKRITGDAAATGREGARRFWQEYLSNFRRVRSTFTNVIESDQSIVLEWTSEAEPQTARPFQYEGVTILETDGGQVHRFRTYYDSAKFLPPE